MSVNELNWENYYNTLQKIPKRLKKLAEFVVNTIPIFKKHNVNRILDLGCGVGRYSIYLANEGFNVLGIDFSKSALKLAKKWSQIVLKDLTNDNRINVEINILENNTTNENNNSYNSDFNYNSNLNFIIYTGIITLLAPPIGYYVIIKYKKSKF